MIHDLLSLTPPDADLSFADRARNIRPSQISSFSHFSSSLPSLNDTGDDLEVADPAEAIIGANSAPSWFVGESVYERIRLGVQCYSDIIPPQCILPSRNNLSRYLEKYLGCVQEFLPFLHPATFSIEHQDVELILAMAAIGSLYTYEHPKAYELYFMAKGILLEKTRREDLQLTSELLSRQSHSTPTGRNDLDKIRVIIMLISFASWADKNVWPDALSMASTLAMLVRKAGIAEWDQISPNIDWISWVTSEERRRTFFAAYVLLNMHSIAFGIPPLILTHEVGMFLPSHADAWKAKNTTEWHQATLQVEYQFQEALHSLFDGSRISKDASVSSFSNFILIHGLLQQIYIDRHGSTGLQGSEVINSFERALRNWQLSWEQTSESTLDPQTPKGPFGLSAAALLRLAYLRLNSDLCPCQDFVSGDFQRITKRSSSLNRSPHVDKAVLHATHALSVPVRLGVEFMASNQTAIWTIEHSLCSLECALLLRDWLEMISTIVGSHGTEGLRKVERKLLDIITGIIKETSFAKTLDIMEGEASHFQRMATTVLKLWAQIFQGNHVLEIDDAIGSSLRLLADSSPN